MSFYHAELWYNSRMKAKPSASTHSKTAKSTKHSAPKEKLTTFGWMVHVWNDETKAVFEKFYALLDSKSEIPRHFFSSRSITRGGTNPIFKFLRLESLHDIINACREIVAKGEREDSELTETANVLTDYITHWEVLRKKLDEYYGDTKTANMARNKLDLLRSASKILDAESDQILHNILHENANINLNIDDARYTRYLESFVDVFSDLPTSPITIEKRMMEAARSGVAKTRRSFREEAELIAKTAAYRLHVISVDHEPSEEEALAIRKAKGTRGRLPPAGDVLEFIKDVHAFCKSKASPKSSLTHVQAVRLFYREKENWEGQPEEVLKRFSPREGERDDKKAIIRLNSMVCRYEESLKSPAEKKAKFKDAFSRRRRKPKTRK